MIASTLLALAEPTRLRIAEFLVDRPRSVTEICEFLGVDQPLVSKHLKALRLAGIVSAEQVQRKRIYSLEAGSLRELSEWVEKFRATWDARYRAVDDLLAELKTLEGEDRDGSNDR